MEQLNKKPNLTPLAVVAAAIIVAGGLVFGNAKTDTTKSVLSPVIAESTFVLESVALPIRWGDIGKQLVDGGVLDAQKFEALYKTRGGLFPEDKKLLTDIGNEQITMTPQNAPILLNMLWAFGLGNKNEILEKGEMSDPEYGGAGNFASTGGWSLARGEAMNHYSKHQFVTLTSEQQELVDRVSKNIYRPCCGNSTHFPDCNHGMAMLGLLELMAANNVSEQEMYQVALKVNALWFPDTYQTIDQYLVKQGKSLMTAEPKEILGVKYSSGQGYAQIKSAVNGVPKSSGGSCSA